MIKINTKQPDKPQDPPKPAAPKQRKFCQEQAVLRFSPTAWAKLLFFRDHGQTEIGGFGVCGAADLLRIEEFMTVKQEVTAASVAFADEAVADFFDAQVDSGKRPEQFARVWLHTHPGSSPQPSGTDDETFARVFGSCQWAAMFVLARNGKTYARLRFNVGPGGQVVIPTQVDYSQPFGASNQEAWEAEYQANIKGSAGLGRSFDDFGCQTGLEDRCVPGDWLEELEAMEPAERRLVLDELSARPDLWEEGGVIDEY